MEQTESQQPKKKYPYVCAVRRRPYLSRAVREKQAERRLEKSLANAAFMPVGDDIAEIAYQPFAVRTHGIMMEFKQLDDSDKYNPQNPPFEWLPGSRRRRRQERMCRKRRRGWA